MTLKLCDEPIYRIETGSSTRKLLQVEGDLWEWLANYANTLQLTYLLGHSLDGVVWGRMLGDKLCLAPYEGNIFGKEFAWVELADILCELRLFSETAELYLWQNNGQWQASLIQDDNGDKCEYIDEPQMLWGTQIADANDHFTLMSDGIQGLHHVVPLLQTQIPVEADGKHRPLRLHVRHYLADDEMGRVHIANSRLIGLTAEGKKEEENGA